MKNLSALIAVLSLAGCFGGTHTTRTKNENYGAQGNLNLGPSANPIPAAGTRTTWVVTRGPVGDFDCVAPTFCYSGFCGEDCRFLGEVVPVDRVTAASCDGRFCDTVITGTAIAITSQEAGTFRLSVTAVLTDGTVLEDSGQVTFYQADSIQLSCPKDSLCPGPNAVFVGAKFQLYATVRAGNSAIGADVTVSVAPAGIVEVSAGGEVHAVAPGSAMVSFSFGTLTASQRVRVVSTDDAMSAELHLSKSTNAEGIFDLGLSLPAEIDVVSTLAPQSVPWFTQLVPVWRLNDGTVALADTRTVTADIPLDYQATAGVPALTFQIFNEGSCVAKSAHVTGSIGAAQLDATIAQTCP